MSTVVHFDDFEPASVNEASIRVLDNGGKIVWLSHTKEKVPIVLQTPVLRTPMGIQCWEESDGKRYSMELALDKDSPAYKAMEEFDSRIVDLAVESKKWVKSKSGAREVVEALYTPALRLARDKDTNEVTDRWPPVLRVKIPQKNGAFECELWDSKRNPLDMAEFIKSGGGKGATVTVILRCTGVWVTGSRFTTTWKAQQIMVHSSSNSALRSFAFLNPEKLMEEECALEAAAPAARAAGKKPAAPAAAPRNRRGGEEEEEADGGDYIDDSE